MGMITAADVAARGPSAAYFEPPADDDGAANAVYEDTLAACKAGDVDAMALFGTKPLDLADALDELQRLVVQSHSPEDLGRTVGAWFEREWTRLATEDAQRATGAVR